MRWLRLLLSFAIGVAVQSTLEAQVIKFSHGVIDNALHFPAARDFRFPYDTIFSSWQNTMPDFHMLADLPPHLMPRVQVLCNKSQLTLLVEKRFRGVQLGKEDLLLGDDCYSNGELEDQFVFTYDFTQCGTNRVLQNGLESFSNLLHFNPRRSPFTWWLVPFTQAISCIPQRVETNTLQPPGFPFPMPFPSMGDWNFAISQMNPSWTDTADAKIYERGQAINLQVIAKTGPSQQPFIQSCFLSTSPDSQFRPRQVVILNKGCAVSQGPDQVMAQFVAPTRKDALNIILDTSTLKSEVYIHCSVVLSDQGVTPGSKSCNYNKIASRWEELSGDVEVCSCCSSKCKGQLPNKRHMDTKAIISTGPLVIKDKETESSPLASEIKLNMTPSADSMQSDASSPIVTEYQASTTHQFMSGAPNVNQNMIASSASFSDGSRKSKTPVAPWNAASGNADGVVILSQLPAARLTMWLSGRVRAASDARLNEVVSTQLASNEVESAQHDSLPTEIPELYPADSPLNPDNAYEGKRLTRVEGNIPPIGWHIPLLDGHPIPPPQLNRAPVAEYQIKRCGRLQMPHTKEQDETLLNDLEFHGDPLRIQRDDPTRHQRSAVAPTVEGSRPVLRSTLQFSKDVDGSQSLSYEEEVLTRDEDKMVGHNGVANGTQKGLLSIFLNLLRKLDRAE